MTVVAKSYNCSLSHRAGCHRDQFRSAKPVHFVPALWDPTDVKGYVRALDQNPLGGATAVFLVSICDHRRQCAAKSRRRDRGDARIKNVTDKQSVLNDKLQSILCLDINNVFS